MDPAFLRKMSLMRRIKNTYLFFLLLTLLVPSFLFAQEEKIRAIINQEITFLMGQELRVDEVWGLRQIEGQLNKPGLSEFLNQQTVHLKNDPFIFLVDPSSPKPILPGKCGQGRPKLQVYLQASIGEPRQRALQLIEQFLKFDGHGYILTHQFLVLKWQEQTQGALPADLSRQKQHLLQKIALEQSEDSVFSDIAAERMAILGLYGQATKEQKAYWQSHILNARLPQGGWPSESVSIEFDGLEAQIIPGSNHTRVLAIMALVATLP